MKRKGYPHNEGMTLIELLIVLALLAGLATFALTSMDDLSARSRYDVTVERMKRVDSLLLGDGITPGRFVADMGRLPTNICELWESGASYDAIPFVNSFAGTAVTGELFCGWGGPYLLVSGAGFYDGFGDEFYLGSDFLTTTGLVGRTAWLTCNLSNSYARATNCSLQVQVHGLRNVPVENEAVWDLVQNTNAVAAFDENPAVEKHAHRLYLYGTNVYACLITNYYTAPTGTSWQIVDQHNYPSEARVMLRVPRVHGAAVQTSLFTRDVTANNPCVFENLAPGVRNIMAYGRSVGVATNNAWWSGLRTVEIRPGMNFVKLYLTEPIR